MFDICKPADTHNQLTHVCIYVNVCVYIHLRFYYLFTDLFEMQNIRERFFHTLVHSTNGCHTCGWARLKPAAGNSILAFQGPKHLGCHQLPCQAREQGAGSEAEQQGLDLVRCSFTCCTLSTGL